MKTTLVRKFEGKPPREAPPPSRWGRGRGGSLFVVRKVGFRNLRGQKLYRLGFHVGDHRGPLFSQELWTLDKLTEQGVVWLDKSPWPDSISDEAPQGDVEPSALIVADEEPEPEAIKPLPPMKADIAKDVAKVKQEVARALSLPAELLKDEPAEPAFVRRHGFKVGQVAFHSESGKPYRILGVIDADTARVEEVAEDGVKRPGRNMRATKLQAVAPKAKK